MKHTPALVGLALAAQCSMALAQSDANPSAAVAQVAAPEPTPVPTPMPAAPVLQPAASAQLVQVRVLSVTQLPAGTPGTSETTYKVVYEHDGRQYSVLLPNNPGEYLTLQLPVATPAPPQAQPAPAVAGTVVIAPAAPVYVGPVMPYPYVVYVGALYRPFPYFGGAHHFSGGRMGGRRGGRH